MWIEHVLPVSQEKIEGITTGGSATAPHKSFGDLLSALPEGDIDIVSQQTDAVSFALSVRSGKASYKLLGLSPDEFPPVPILEGNTTFQIKSEEFREAIRQTIIAVSTDDTRPILTGILMSYKNAVLNMVATDTHRLSVRQISLVNANGSDVQAVIPARAMGEVLRMASAENAIIEVTLSENQVQFQVEDAALGTSTRLTTRLIEGQFPSYERVVPKYHDKRVTVQRDWLLSALRRAAIVAREQTGANRVVLRTEKGEYGDVLTITAQSSGTGDAYEVIDIARAADEPDIEIAFNVKYLVEVLGILDGEGLYLDLTESLRPGVVRPTETNNYFCVLMPMQVA
jgi:DNA polymerase-3 subunit beta